ncbi:hypothetical protein SAMN02745174_02570 [Cetobacterium ceti]|uniref:Lipoprotein n=1 Tax=Cetobacterium ceti TaxID=180163 RepID=A0A1T4R4D0_9FUSO|nr:hypothetical protein [Cetobacterium ceti]SKA10900.1 hypothetical protein SAMN02745174_02570 [Cetobacterium ceti]
MKNLLFGLFVVLVFVSCGSNESAVKKYLPGNYSQLNKEKKSIGFGYYKEVTIKHLKGNEYRINCTANDMKYYIDRKLTKVVKTPDIFDFEISSVTLKQKSDSIAKYYIDGFVTNIIENGTTFSEADRGINSVVIISLTIGKNEVEALIGGKSLPAIRKK